MRDRGTIAAAAELKLRSLAGVKLVTVNGEHGKLFAVDVLTASEEGLLGLAFHPRFEDNGRIFVDYVADVGGKDT